MAKKKVDEEAEMFKNLSSDKKVVYGAECSKQLAKRNNNKRIKKEQEKYATDSEEETPKVKVEEVLETPTVDNVVEEKEVVEFSSVIDSGDIIEETPISEEDVNVEQIILEEEVEKTETVEDVEKIKETIQTEENNKTEKPKSKKLPYDVKRMFGYNWLGVVYDEY